MRKLAFILLAICGWLLVTLAIGWLAPVGAAELMDATTQGLMQAGAMFPGAQVTASPLHPTLVELAQDHAAWQAEREQLGHQGFCGRFTIIQQNIGLSAAEICAESWPEQAGDSMTAVGWEMFKCWRQSPGHWRVAAQKHRYWGGAMRQGRNGIWYATIIVAD